MATHREHNLDRKKGWYETDVQKIAFDNGYSVILQKEDHTVKNMKNVEGTWDGKRSSRNRDGKRSSRNSNRTKLIKAT